MSGLAFYFEGWDQDFATVVKVAIGILMSYVPTMDIARSGTLGKCRS
jgi:hypothetical protein